MEQPKSHNIRKEASRICQAEREERIGCPAVTVWLTGLSGSGKSTLANLLERRLFDLGQRVFWLDGDNVRFGLNRDLGFSPEDRSENIRRVASVAQLFNEAGTTVIASFISPYAADRERAREVIGAERFIQVFLSTPLEVCEARDTKGLYAKARAGKIEQFTGINAPYEEPGDALLTLDTSQFGPDECIDQILQIVPHKTKES